MNPYYTYDLISSTYSCPSCSRELPRFVTEAFSPESGSPKTFTSRDVFKTSKNKLVKNRSFTVYSKCSFCSQFIKGEVKIKDGHIVDFKNDPESKFWVSARAYFDGLQAQDTVHVRMLSVLEAMHES